MQKDENYMAKVTIKISDEALEDESFKVDFVAEGSEIEEGQATASYFTAYYLHTLVGDQSFINMATGYGFEIIEAMAVNAGKDTFPRPTQKAQMLLVFTDEDINLGSYQAELIMEGGDPTGQSQPTTAQVIGLFMRSLIDRDEFRQDCWDFARAFVADRDDAHITNDETLADLSEDAA